MKKRTLFISLAVIVTSIAAAFILFSSGAKADVNYNDLMDNAVFENAGSMNPGQIDNFLNGFSNSCISSNPNGNGNPGFRTADPKGWSASQNQYIYGGNVTAGQAIYDIAQIYHINPQVILATMQKEQSIVSGSAGCHYNTPDPSTATPMTDACGPGTQSCTLACPSSYGGGCMNIAMSYACPNYCKASDEGFSKQLTLGTWLLRFGEERSQGITSGYAGYDPGDSSIGYGGPQVGVQYTLLDGNTVTPQTGATASLYYYTPFKSPSFDNIFTSWFGSVTADFTVAVADSGDTTTQYLLYGTIKQRIPSGAIKIDWGLGGYNPVTMNASILASIPNGPDLGRLFRVNGGAAVYFVDGGQKYWVNSSQMMAAWNNFDGAAVASVPSDLAGAPSDAGSLTYNIKSSSSNNQYMVDGGDGSSANGNNGNIFLRQYPSSSVLQAFEGDNVGVTTITDSSYFSAMTQGSALTSNGVTIKTASDPTQYQVVAGQKMYLSGSIALLYNQTPEVVSQATIDRLVTTSPASQFIRLPGNGVTIYMVDGGTIHAMPSLSLLEAWLPSTSTNINILNNGFLNLMTSGSTINSYEADVSGQLYVMNGGQALTVPSGIDGFYRVGTPYSTTSNLIGLYSSGTASIYAKGPGSPSVYLMDDGTIRHIASANSYVLWSGNQAPTNVPDPLLSQFSTGSDITSNYVTNGSSNAAIDNGTYYTVSNSVASDWGYSTPISINSATLATLNSGGALSNAVRSGASYYLMKYGTSHLTYNTNLANIWGVNTNGTSYSQAFVNSLPTGPPLTIFVRSTDSNDLRVFVADTGSKLYDLNSIQQAQNYGYISGSMLQLTPSDINAMAITNAQNILQQGSTSNYVALDNGAERPFNSTQVQNSWLASGNQTSVSNNLWSFIPTGSNIGSTIKGSAPNIYSVQSGQKSWIQSWQTYSSTYAPYSNVSDYLTYLLPNGANIP